jgi:kinesin family protein 3/17
VKYLIIENFIPVDEKNKLLARIRYDDEEDTFCISPYEEEAPNISKRPVSADDERRPLSDYSRVAIKVGRHHRYYVSNVKLHIVLDESYSALFLHFQLVMCSLGSQLTLGEH